MKDDADNEFLTDRERDFLRRKKKKDQALTSMKIKESTWLKREHERAMNRLPNEYRHRVKDRSPFPSYVGLYWSDNDD